MYEKNPNKTNPLPDNFVRRVLIVVGTTLSVAILLLILWYVVEVLLLAFAGILLATLLRGLSGLISKRIAIPEKWSLAIVGFILVAVFGGGIFLLAPDVADQFDQLSQSLAQSLQQLEQELEKHAWGRNVLAMLPQGEEQIFSRANFLAGVSGIFSTTLSALAGILIILFIGIYVAVEPDLYTGGIVQLVPVRKRARARQVLDEVGYTLRWWLIGQMVSMCVLGTLTGVGLWLLGVPLALTLGLLIGLLTFIPYLGPIIGTVPVVLVALLQSPTKAFYVFFDVHRHSKLRRIFAHAAGAKARGLIAARAHDHGTSFAWRLARPPRHCFSNAAHGRYYGDSKNDLHRRRSAWFQ